MDGSSHHMENERRENGGDEWRDLLLVLEEMEEDEEDTEREGYC